MQSENKLYEYKKILPHTPHARGNQETNIVDGGKEFVLQYIAMQEFGELFGGYLKGFEEPKTAEHREFIGVWGKDRVAEFKRILQERGAEFESCIIDGNTRQISVTSQQRTRQ
jgi:hypothetical protein